MKKFAIAALLAATVSANAFANDTHATTHNAPATTTTVAPAAADHLNDKSPAAGMTKATRTELKDGNWAETGADGMVRVSKDGGKTWQPAPDGTWDAKDGTKLTTKAGKVVAKQ